MFWPLSREPYLKASNHFFVVRVDCFLNLIKASGKFSSIGWGGVLGAGCISQSLGPKLPESQKPGPHDDRSKKVFAWFIFDHQGDCVLKPLLHQECEKY